jgi:hypothetical protein
MGDLDIAEMFLNFVLHELIHPHCGVDLTTLFPEEVQPGGVLWEHWERCGMGLTPLPYQSIQGVLWAKEYILGDRQNPSDPFRFDPVQFNLPGSPDHNPTLPCVCKLRASGDPASELLIYVDDLRTIAATVEDCWQACRYVASLLNFLGLQDASRKWRHCDQEAGAWSGSIVHTTGDTVKIMISNERWEKT